MNIDNLQRAVDAKEELNNLNTAIENAKKLGDGFIIACWFGERDGVIETQYKNGNYHPMYLEIKNFIIQKLEEAKEQLIKEIELLWIKNYLHFLWSSI